MGVFSCKGCAAKDAEIARLTQRLQANDDRADRQATEILKLARDAAGLTPPPDPGPPFDPLPPIVEEFLDQRFERGTAEWRRQRREAMKLLAQANEPMQVNELLNRGQEVPW